MFFFESRKTSKRRFLPKVPASNEFAIQHQHKIKRTVKLFVYLCAKAESTPKFSRLLRKTLAKPRPEEPLMDFSRRTQIISTMLSKNCREFCRHLIFSSSLFFEKKSMSEPMQSYLATRPKRAALYHCAPARSARVPAPAGRSPQARRGAERGAYGCSQGSGSSMISAERARL